jgi:hypothetical protein
LLDLLHEFVKGLGRWSDRHSHTIALLEAVSTTAAVIVALWVAVTARLATRPRLKATVSVYMRAHPSPSGRPSYLFVHVTNTGTVPVRLRPMMFAWRVRFRRRSALLVPLDEGASDANVTQRAYPIVLPPNHTERITLTDLHTFTSEVLPQMRAMAPFGGMVSLRFLLRAVVFTDDNHEFAPQLDSSLRNKLTVRAPSNPAAD